MAFGVFCLLVIISYWRAEGGILSLGLFLISIAAALAVYNSHAHIEILTRFVNAIIASLSSTSFSFLFYVLIKLT